MRRILLFCTVLLCAAAGLMAAARLPVDTDTLVRSKYDSWCGVLRVWVAEDCGPFRPTQWLNICAAAAEKQLSGVYINIRSVPSEAIAELHETGINPPDLIIYPRGLIADSTGLNPITCTYPLRSGLTRDAYALPILLDARFWIYRGSLPGDLYNTALGCRPEDTAALVGLCSGLREEYIEDTALPGLDLGLTGESAAPAAPSGMTACRVNPDIAITDDPALLYIEDDVDAFPASIADLRRLESSADISVAVTGTCAIVTDALMCSVVTSDPDKAAAVNSFIDSIMTEGQSAAARASGFAAVTGASAWADDLYLALAEAALEGLTWRYAPSSGSTAAQQYIEGTLTADEALMQMAGSQ